MQGGLTLAHVRSALEHVLRHLSDKGLLLEEKTSAGGERFPLPALVLRAFSQNLRMEPTTLPRICTSEKYMGAKSSFSGWRRILFSSR